MNSISISTIDVPKGLGDEIDMDTDEVSRMYWSMRDRGLLQPIQVRQTEGGRHELISGLKRLACARKLGWTDIPATLATTLEGDRQTEPPTTRKPLIESKLTDRGWLQMCDDNGGPRPNLAKPEAYDRAALMYRQIRGGRDLFKATYKGDFKVSIAGGGDPFTRLWVNTLSVDHPQNWLCCGECNGSGKHPHYPAEECDLCSGDGFVLTFIKKKPATA